MTVDTQMLAPGAALVCWSMIVMVWMTVSRFIAIARHRKELKDIPVGVRGHEVDRQLPREVAWRGHNYMHLMEQPTIFYPTIIILALVGAQASDIRLAWAYVGLRVLHSLWQGVFNRLPVRIVLFAASSICLMSLAFRAFWAVVPL